MKEIIFEDTLIKIGTNAQENWKLFENSMPNYILFHLSSFPSCYVIIEKEIDLLETENHKIYENIIREGSNICKNNTKYKNLKNIYVDYTNCKNIIKGEKVGEIIYKSNKKVNKIKID
jgi:hypothetical protein